MSEEKIFFEREVRANGGSLICVIPPEVCQYLGIEDGAKIRWVADISKHGKFVGVWNPKTQEAKK